MTITTLVITNAILGFSLVYAVASLLLSGVHADRRHRSQHAAEVRALPLERRDRVAA